MAHDRFIAKSSYVSRFLDKDVIRPSVPADRTRTRGRSRAVRRDRCEERTDESRGSPFTRSGERRGSTFPFTASTRTPMLPKLHRRDVQSFHTAPMFAA